MLLGGAGVALAFGLVGGAIVWAASSSQSAIGFALGALIGLAALALSQIIVIAASKLPESTVLVVALAAFGLGIGATVVVLGWIRDHTTLSTTWLAGGVVVGGVGYLIGLAVAYRWLRIPVYSHSQPPDHHSTS